MVRRRLPHLFNKSFAFWQTASPLIFACRSVHIFEVIWMKRRPLVNAPPVCTNGKATKANQLAELAKAVIKIKLIRGMISDEVDRNTKSDKRLSDIQKKLTDGAKMIVQTNEELAACKKDPSSRPEPEEGKIYMLGLIAEGSSRSMIWGARAPNICPRRSRPRDLSTSGCWRTRRRSTIGSTPRRTCRRPNRRKRRTKKWRPRTRA